MISILYLALGGVLFAGALICCFVKRLHPAGMALLATAMAFLGALLFQIALATRTVNAFAAVGSKSDAPYGGISDSLLELLKLNQLGLALLLAVSVAVGLQWWRRRVDLSLDSRLTRLGNGAWLGILFVLAFLLAGFWVIHENSRRLLELSTATLAPEGAEGLPQGLVRVMAGFETMTSDDIAREVSFRLIAGALGSLVLGLLPLALTVLSLLMGWTRQFPAEDPPPKSGSAPRPLFGLAIQALVSLLVLAQLWRLEEIKPWFPAIQAALAVASQEVAAPMSELNVWLVQVDPVYPQAARSAGVEGEVLVRVTVDSKGNVTDASVVGGDPLLRQAAIDAVLQWKMDPALLQGSEEPESLMVNVEVKPD